MLGPPAAREEHFLSRVQKTKELHEAIPEVADPATELTLGRLCANVSRVTHLLRVSGTMLSEKALLEHDDASATFVARALGGDLPAHSSSQAALGIKMGGLGFRQAASLAAPAALASMVEARPFVNRLFTAMGEAGVVLDRRLARFDSKVRHAKQLFQAQLSDNRAARVDSICERSAAMANERPTAIAAGSHGSPGRQFLKDCLESGFLLSPVVMTQSCRALVPQRLCSCSMCWLAWWTVTALTSSPPASLPAQLPEATRRGCKSCKIPPAPQIGFGPSTRSQLQLWSQMLTSQPHACGWERGLHSSPCFVELARGSSTQVEHMLCAVPQARAREGTTMSETQCSIWHAWPTPQPKKKS